MSKKNKRRKCLDEDFANKNRSKKLKPVKKEKYHNKYDIDDYEEDQ